MTEQAKVQVDGKMDGKMPPMPDHGRGWVEWDGEDADGHGPVLPGTQVEVQFRDGYCLTCTPKKGALRWSHRWGRRENDVVRYRIIRKRPPSPPCDPGSINSWIACFGDDVKCPATRKHPIDIQFANGTVVYGTEDEYVWAWTGGESDIVSWRYCPVDYWAKADAEAAYAESDPSDVMSTQVGGMHYKDLAIQPWQYIHANKLGFFEGTAIAYITRWQLKGGIEDLKKAIHTLQGLIALTEGEERGDG